MERAEFPAATARDREVFAQLRGNQLLAAWVWSGSLGFCRSARIHRDDLTPGVLGLYYAGVGRTSPQPCRSGQEYEFTECIHAPER